MKGLLISKVRNIAQSEGISVGQALSIARSRGIVVLEDFPQIAREEQQQQDNQVALAKERGISQTLSINDVSDIEKLNKRRSRKLGTIQGRITKDGLDTLIAKKIEEAKATSQSFNAKILENSNFDLGIPSTSSPQKRQATINNLRKSFAQRLLNSGGITQKEFSIAEKNGFRGIDNLGRSEEERFADNEKTRKIAEAIEPINNKFLLKKINKNSRTVRFRGNNQISSKALARLLEKGVITTGDLT